jgi:hypothetical protein
LWQVYCEVLLPHTPIEVDVEEHMGQDAPRCRFVIYRRSGDDRG